MTNKLFVAGLAYSVTDSQLEEHFSKAGKVMSAKVITDRYSGQSKGFGFVEMSTEEEAQNAMTTLNNTAIEDRNIVVKEARPQEQRAPFSENRTFTRGNNRGGQRDGRRQNRR
jgi:cold-inducible RNA-binding protein